MSYLPVRYSPNGEVQVQSGEPNLRGKTHSKWSVEPGKTAISPPGSTEPDPEGILTRIEGGESSENQWENNCIYFKNKPW